MDLIRPTLAAQAGVVARSQLLALKLEPHDPAVRLSWGQVFDRSCSTAAKVSRLLVARGWPAGRACGSGCALEAAA